MLRIYPSRLIHCSLLAASMLAAVQASGTTATWVGTAGSAWTDVNNWTTTAPPTLTPPASVPGSPGGATTDTAAFNASASSFAVTVDPNRRPFQLNISGGSGYTFSGGPLIITNGLSNFVNASGTASHTFNNSFGFVNSGSGGISSSGTGSASVVVNGNIAGRNGGTNTFQLLGSNTNTTNSVTGSISNGTGGNVMSVSKSGTGTWTLGGTHNYTGATTISAGTLLLTGTLSSSSAVSVTGGTLGGTGNAARSVSLSGTGILAPGTGTIGTLATGTLSSGSGATLAIEFNSTSPGADRVNIGGDFNIASGTILTLADLGGNSLISPGTLFTLFDYSGSWDGGQFTYLGNTLVDNSTFTLGANTFQVDYNNGTAFTLTTVPEPSATGMIVLALCSLWVWRGRFLRARHALI